MTNKLVRLLTPPNYDKMIKKILKFNRKLRYISVLDKNGRRIAGGMRRGIKSLEPAEEELRLMSHVESESSTRETWDSYFGKTMYTIVKRENVTMIIYPHDKKNILVSAEPVFNINEVPDIRELIIEYMENQ